MSKMNAVLSNQKNPKVYKDIKAEKAANCHNGCAAMLQTFTIIVRDKRCSFFPSHTDRIQHWHLCVAATLQLDNFTLH